jgi:hypothetical protein
MLQKIKNKLFRTRQLVKKAQEDLDALKQTVERLEESCARTVDGPLAWSPSLYHRWQRVLGCLRMRSLGTVGKVRVGADADGGYVIPADWKAVPMLISLGIGPENSFDMSFAEAGISVEAYDPTISQLPQIHPKIRWIQSLVVANPRPNSKEVSLENVLERVSSDNLPVLKMDIEGWEYPVLLSCSERSLGKIRFFVAEFHGIADAVATENTATLEATWKKLSSKFDTVHIHANNAGGARVLGGALIPNLLEITMVNRDLYKTSASMGLYPNSLDRPNIKEKAEIQLNSLVCDENFENDISHIHK